MHAADEVIAIADRLGAGAAKALLGKAALPDDLPWVTGAIGLLGTAPSSDMMDACDTLLMIGTGFPWSEFLPKHGQARAVQIDIDATMLGIRYDTEVNLHGEAAETLRALLPLLDQQTDASWRETIAEGMKDWWALTGETGARPRRAHQSAARDMGTLAPAAERRDSDLGFRLLRQLVRARPEDPARHGLLAVRRSGLDGRGGALRDRRQVRASGPARHRARRRWRHADEQHGGSSSPSRNTGSAGPIRAGSAASGTTRISTR